MGIYNLQDTHIIQQKKMCRVSARRLSIYNIVLKKKFSISKMKRSYEGYPTEFAGSTQNHEKTIETPNQPIKTNFPKKKRMFVPQK
jgi:hypothetical protein